MAVAAPRTDGAARLTYRPAVREGRREVTRLDVRSVARFSLIFYLALAGVFLLMGTVLWLLAAAAGLVGGTENFIKSLFGFTSFHFAALRIFLGALVAGVVLALFGTLANVVGAAVYNLIAEAVGGIRIHVSEEGVRPHPGGPPRPPAGRPLV